MKIEEISALTVEPAAQLRVELWPDAELEEEREDCERILGEERETLFLVKMEEAYIGFIYLGLRMDYVEGTTTSPVAYIEGIYVKPAYQKHGIGRKLVELGENWGREKGAKEYASDTELHNEVSIAFHQAAGFEIANRVVCFSKKIKSE